MKEQERVMNETVDVTFPVGVSGMFLRDKVKFSQLDSLFAELSSARKRLSDAEAQLRNCNHPAWLISFEKRCRRLKREPKQELISLVCKLEAEKIVLQATINDVRHKLRQLEPTAFDTITTLAGLHLPMAVPARRRMPNPDVIARNAVIDAHLDHSDFAICQILDVEFSSSNGRIAAGLPDSWEIEYGVLTFCEAYHQCPQLVHTLISKRRGRNPLPYQVTAIDSGCSPLICLDL
jgi:hypothetical protein